MFDITQLDQHLAFLQSEIAYLREQRKRWADQKADRLEQIREVLRKVRQTQQMTGMSGKSIG